MTERAPWWLWPNILSLDAPIIAVLWQWFLCQAFGVPWSIGLAASLGLAVWLVYLADHWLDARRATDPTRLAARHRIHRHGRGVDAVVFLTAVAAAGTLALWSLPIRQVMAGIGVGIVVMMYLAVVHRANRAKPLSCDSAPMTTPVPGETAASGLTAKELTVGLVFAAGTGLPVWAADPIGAALWGPSLGLFAGVCATNCLLIAAWESRPPTPRFVAVFPWALAGLGVVASTPIGAAVALASSVLAGLDRIRDRLPPTALRVLADVALLTPIPVHLLAKLRMFC